MAYKQQTLISRGLEVGKFKIKKVPADLMSDEGLLPGSEMIMSSLCPHMAEGTRDSLGLFHKGTNPIREGSTFMI